ncbi:hypothetical protein HXX76_002983 [Chlamydomonas incerta]|uniref:ADP-ribosyl cyclase/cyclic ADP-ribose hydrolase n=1 Tax=Chlamydomonas incerta TaxID=51695 RepID=A0A835TFQ4_CHLIN|nr:hypothetical protein HXX76_002983 [Chlamydomonas incerta]|eukprot:KAG2442907.1 hypothetical protein HXX76_002983 [Chlamydomonas incerta]
MASAEGAPVVETVEEASAAVAIRDALATAIDSASPHVRQFQAELCDSGALRQLYDLAVQRQPIAFEALRLLAYRNRIGVQQMVNLGAIELLEQILVREAHSGAASLALQAAALQLLTSLLAFNLEIHSTVMHTKLVKRLVQLCRPDGHVHGQSMDGRPHDAAGTAAASGAVALGPGTPGAGSSSGSPDTEGAVGKDGGERAGGRGYGLEGQDRGAGKQVTMHPDAPIILSSEQQSMAACAAAALRNLCHQIGNHPGLLAAGAALELAAVMQREPDPYRRINATMAVALLVGHEEQHPLLRMDEAGMREMLTVLSCACARVMCHGYFWTCWKVCQALARLSANEDNKPILTREGGVGVLAGVLCAEEHARKAITVKYCVEALWNLAFYEPAREQILANPALVAAICAARQSGLDLVREVARGCLFTLGVNENGQRRAPHVPNGEAAGAAGAGHHGHHGGHGGHGGHAHGQPGGSSYEASAYLGSDGNQQAYGHSHGHGHGNQHQQYQGPPSGGPHPGPLRRSISAQQEAMAAAAAQAAPGAGTDGGAWQASAWHVPSAVHGRIDEDGVTLPPALEMAMSSVCSSIIAGAPHHVTETGGVHGPPPQPHVTSQPLPTGDARSRRVSLSARPPQAEAWTGSAGGAGPMPPLSPRGTRQSQAAAFSQQPQSQARPKLQRTGSSTSSRTSTMTNGPAAGGGAAAGAALSPPYSSSLYAIAPSNHAGGGLHGHGHSQSLAQLSTASSTTVAAGGGAAGPTAHIMISYEWGSQQKALLIKEALERRGLVTWMDIEKMSGSTLEAMALAVEGAAAVLLCISKRYKESQACRAEAEYAYQQRKRIIPIMMERGYRPTGWLGILIGTKLYFDCSERRLIPERMGALERELGPLARQCRRHATSSLSAHVSANAGGGGGGPGSVMSMRTAGGGGGGSGGGGVVGRRSRRTSITMASPPASVVGVQQQLHYTPQQLQQHAVSLAYQNPAHGSATSLPQSSYSSQGPGPTSSHISLPLPHHAWGSQVSLHSVKNARSHAQHLHQHPGQHAHGGAHAGHHHPHPHHHKVHHVQFAEAANPQARDGPAAAAAAAAALQGRGGARESLARGLSPHIPEDSSLTELDLCMGAAHSPRPQPPRGTRGRMSLEMPRTQVGAFGAGVAPTGAAGGPWNANVSSFRSLRAGTGAELEPWSEDTTAPSSQPIPPPLAAFEASPAAMAAAYASAPPRSGGGNTRHSGGGGGIGGEAAGGGLGVVGVGGLRVSAGRGHGNSESQVVSGEIGGWQDTCSEATAEQEWHDPMRDPLALPPLPPLEEEAAARRPLALPSGSAAAMAGRATEVLGVGSMSKAAGRPAVGVSAEGPEVETVGLDAVGRGTGETPAKPAQAPALDSAAAEGTLWEARAQPEQRSPLRLLLQQHQARLAAEDAAAAAAASATGAGRHHAGTMSECSSNADLAALAAAATAACVDGSSAAGSSVRSSRPPTPPSGAAHGSQAQLFQDQAAASQSASVNSHNFLDSHLAELRDAHSSAAASGNAAGNGAWQGTAGTDEGRGPASPRLKRSLDFGVLASAQTEVTSQPFIRRSALYDSWEEDVTQPPPPPPPQLQPPKPQPQESQARALAPASPGLYATAAAVPTQQEAKRSASAAPASAPAATATAEVAAGPAATGVKDDSASPLLMVTLSSMPSNLSDDMLLPGLPRAFDDAGASPQLSAMSAGAAMAAAHADVDAAAPESGGSLTDREPSPEPVHEVEADRGGGEGEGAGSGPEAGAPRDIVGKWRSMPGTPCGTPYASSLGSAGSYASPNNSVTSAQGICLSNLVAAASHPHHPHSAHSQHHHTSGAHDHSHSHHRGDSAPRLLDANFASEGSSAGGAPGLSAAAAAAAAYLVEPESGNDDMSSIEPSPQVRLRLPHRLASVETELDSGQQSGSGQDPSVDGGRGGAGRPGVIARRQVSAPHPTAAAGLRHVGTSNSLTAASECAASDYPCSGHGVGYAGAPSDVDSVALGTDTDVFLGSGPSVSAGTAGAAAATGSGPSSRMRRQGSGGLDGASGAGAGGGSSGAGAGGLHKRSRSRLALCSAAAEEAEEAEELEEMEEEDSGADAESSDAAEVAPDVSALMPGPGLSAEALAAAQEASRARRALLRREKGRVLPSVSGGTGRRGDSGAANDDAEEGEESGMVRQKASGSCESLEPDGSLPSEINGDLLGLASAWGRDATEQFVHVLGSGPLPAPQQDVAASEADGVAGIGGATPAPAASVFTTAAATASAPSSVASSQQLPVLGPTALSSGVGSGRHSPSAHSHSSALGPVRSGPGGVSVGAADIAVAFGSVMPTAQSGRMSSEGQRSLSLMSSENITASWLARLSPAPRHAASPGQGQGQRAAPSDSGTSGVASSTSLSALAAAAGSLPPPSVPHSQPPSQAASGAVPIVAAPAATAGTQAAGAAAPAATAAAAPTAPAAYVRTPLLASLLRPVTAVLASVVGGNRSGASMGRSNSGSGKKGSRAASLTVDGAAQAAGRGSSVDSMRVNVGDAAAGAGNRTSAVTLGFVDEVPSGRASAARGSIEAHPVMFDSDHHDSHHNTGEAGSASPADTAHGELSNSGAAPGASQRRRTTASMENGALGAFGSPCLEGAGSASLGYMALAATAALNRSTRTSFAAAATAGSAPGDAGSLAQQQQPTEAAGTVAAAPQGRPSLSLPQVNAVFVASAASQHSVTAAGVVSPFAAASTSRAERHSLDKLSVVAAAGSVSMPAADGAPSVPAAGPAAAAPQSALAAAKWKALSWARGSPAVAEAAAAAVTVAARGAGPNALAVAMASAASGVDGDADDLVGERLAMLLDGSGRRSLALERRPAGYDINGDDGGAAGRGGAPTRFGRAVGTPGSAYGHGPAAQSSRRSVDVPWAVWRSGTAAAPQLQQQAGGGGAAAGNSRRGPEYPVLDDGEASQSDVMLEQAADGLAAAQQALLQQGSAWRGAAGAPPAPGMLAAMRANSHRSMLSNGSAGAASASAGWQRHSRPPSVLGGAGATGGRHEGEDEFRDAVDDGAGHGRPLIVIGGSSANQGPDDAGDDATGELAAELLGEEEQDGEDDHDGDGDERGREYDGYDGYDEFYDGEDVGFGTPGRPRVSGEGALGYGELGGAGSGGLRSHEMGGGEHHGGEGEEAVDVPSSTSMLVEKWGGAQVRDWLVRVGHGELADGFEEQGITGRALCGLIRVMKGGGGAAVVRDMLRDELGVRGLAVQLELLEELHKLFD